MTRALRRGLWLPLLILGCGLLVWNWTRTSFFWADDWLNFGQARQYGMGVDLLKLGYFGHFAPGHRVIDWTLVNWFRTSWGWWLAMMFACYAIAVAAFGVLTRELGASRWLAAGATAFFALSSVWVRLFQWEASSAHVAPGMTAAVVSVAAGVGWMNRRRPWMIGLSAMAMAAGLLFYEKPALVFGYLILLGWVRSDHVRPRDLLASVRDQAPLLSALLVVLVVYAIVLTTGDYSGAGPHASAQQWWDFLRRSWTEGTFTLLAAQGSPEYAPSPPLGLLVAAQGVLLGLIGLSIRRARRAWRSWAFLLIVWIAVVGSIGYGRLGSYGVGIALDPRYYAELAFLIPLAIVLAFTERPGPGRTWSRGGRGRRVGIVGTCAALFLASTLNSFDRLEDHWDGTQSRRWADTLRDAARNARDAGGVISLFDDNAPFEVSAINRPPYSRLQLIVPLVLTGRQIVFDGGGERPSSVAQSGRIVPAPLRRVAGGDVVDGEAGIDVVGGSARRGDRGLCAAGRALVRLRTSTVVTPGILLRVRVVPEGGRRWRAITVTADRGPGTTTAEPPIFIRPRQRSSGEIPANGRLRAVTLSVPAGTCLSGVDLVRVRGTG